MKDYSLYKVCVGKYRAFVSFGLDKSDIATEVIFEELADKIKVIDARNIGRAIMFFNYENRRKHLELLKKEMECLE